MRQMPLLQFTIITITTSTIISTITINRSQLSIIRITTITPTSEQCQRAAQARLIKHASIRHRIVLPLSELLALENLACM